MRPLPSRKGWIVSNCADELFSLRREFSEEEWIDELLRSAGYEPAQFDQRVKWHLLCRMAGGNDPVGPSAGPRSRPCQARDQEDPGPARVEDGRRRHTRAVAARIARADYAAVFTEAVKKAVSRIMNDWLQGGDGQGAPGPHGQPVPDLVWMNRRRYHDPDRSPDRVSKAGEILDGRLPLLEIMKRCKVIREKCGEGIGVGVPRLLRIRLLRLLSLQSFLHERNFCSLPLIHIGRIDFHPERLQLSCSTSPINAEMLAVRP